MRHRPGVQGHNVWVSAGSARDEEGPEEGRRPLGPGEQHARFGLIRRAPGTETEWFLRHWFALMVTSILVLVLLFVYFAVRTGFDWATIFFGVVAGLGLVAIAVRLVFADYYRDK
jgi:hypothetical protein